MLEAAEIRAWFGRFENLNLLALMHDLRDGRVARQAWLSGSFLCPMAHGLPSGPRVRELHALGQADEVSMGCHFAARLLGADAEAVMRFVRMWDDEVINSDWLIQRLDQVWAERLEDAEVMQTVLQFGRRHRNRRTHLIQSIQRSHARTDD